MAAATMLDELELTQAAAKKIVKIAIEQEAYDSDMPASKKEQIEAAHEIVAFCIDAWKNDGARPDDKDEEVAEGAKAILKIFDIAGITADDDGTIEFASSESDEEEDEEGEENGDGEEPFSPDDYIEGYTELSPASRVKAIKALDPEEDEDYNALVALEEWENEQDKPSSRVLDLIADLIGEEEAAEEGDEDEDESDEEEEIVDEEEEEEEDEEEDEEELEEPWDDYDTAKVTEIKAKLNEVFEDGELTTDQLEYVKDYEEAKAQPRVRILKLVDELSVQLENGEGEEEPEEEEEETPARARPSKKRASKKASKAENNGEVDEDALKELVPAGLAHTFVKSKLHDKALAVAGLGEPANWDGDMPELPNEIADMDHDELSNLLAQFVNAHSTALWNASKCYVEADAYEDIAEYLENVELTEVEGSNEAQRKAFARTADQVITARALQKDNYHNYVRFRDLAKTLYERYRAVSRVGGFVGDDAEAEEGTAAKSSTRGKAAGAGRGKDRSSGRARARR